MTTEASTSPAYVHPEPAVPDYTRHNYADHDFSMNMLRQLVVHHYDFERGTTNPVVQLWLSKQKHYTPIDGAPLWYRLMTMHTAQTQLPMAQIIAHYDYLLTLARTSAAIERTSFCIVAYPGHGYSGLSKQDYHQLLHRHGFYRRASNFWYHPDQPTTYLPHKKGLL